MRMRNKLIILLMLILCISFVSSDTYNAGDIIELGEINDCEGPVRINVQSAENITKKNIKFEKTILEKEYWEGQCSNNFEVVMKTNPDFSGSFDVQIEYYLDYIKPKKNETNDITSRSFVFNEVEKRMKSYNNITIGIIEKKNDLNFINENIKKLKFVCLIIIILIILFLFLFIKIIISKEEESNDILNYKVK